ncbi:sialidase family protein [Mucilaginibacter sp.]|uniref:sialidase family protein n=1 Tax=Mucilaginibacter sp. TaxID=1882438 RepID=UPI0026011AD1|nr:sialidase family protein [Mucilaginibacter sp.]
MKTLQLYLLFFTFLLVSCSHSGTTAQAQVQKKISQFNNAGFCDFLIDKNGVYHAVFQETPDNGKPKFIYYATSTNKGATWSKPVTLSNDNTGNGAGYPSILQDASGRIYAIWKRYGSIERTLSDVSLDGPGGGEMGTLYYKVLSGGAWSNAIQLNEMIGAQQSWFATVAPTGVVCVFWTQGDPAQVKQQHIASWYYCDYVRVATLNGASPSAYSDLTTPSQPADPKDFPPKQDGAINLNGYVDKAGKPHLIFEEIDAADKAQKIKYFDGATQRYVYSYPKSGHANTYYNPPRLLVDEKGTDHVIFLPEPSTLESAQVWDINLATNKTNVLTAVEKKGVSIYGYQARQGPNGQMAVVIEVGGWSGNWEAFGMFYTNGAWKNLGLTNNAAKEKFFSKDFIGVGGYLTNVAMSTTYRSNFASVAYDATGRKSMLMTIAEHAVGNGGYSTENPFITYMQIDR